MPYGVPSITTHGQRFTSSMQPDIFAIISSVKATMIGPSWSFNNCSLKSGIRVSLAALLRSTHVVQKLPPIGTAWDLQKPILSTSDQRVLHHPAEWRQIRVTTMLLRRT